MGKLLPNVYPTSEFYSFKKHHKSFTIRRYGVLLKYIKKKNAIRMALESSKLSPVKRKPKNSIIKK